MNIQVNVRLDQQLLNDIDTIAKVLHVSRTEWLRMKIAWAVKDDAINLREAIALEFARNRIDDDDLKNILGSDADDIITIVRQLKEGKKDIDDMIEKGKL